MCAAALVCVYPCDRVVSIILRRDRCSMRFWSLLTKLDHAVSIILRRDRCNMGFWSLLTKLP
ncbi:Tubby-like F-box protein 7 [Zea mays]|uniref:Tubby-like F-box protein 7 n=1 Tax=Zea mays TaxID=4577 RepID=A0A1D6G1H1_MAIZE|nr:Tubby-like F-box protein 7 [Zea mays]